MRDAMARRLRAAGRPGAAPARDCLDCGEALDAGFRFCPHCGAAQRLKVVEHFGGDPALDEGGLRVSVYLQDEPQVRLSVWRDEAAEAALALSPAEARRLAAFLDRFVPEPPSLRPVRRALDVLRAARG